jgi:hypothetical protein
MAWFWFWRTPRRTHVDPRSARQSGDFERFSRAYEAANFRFTQANQQVALATRELFAGWFPGVFRPLVRSSIHALLDPPLLSAFGLQPAPRWLVWTAEHALRLRARVLRWLPRTPASETAHADSACRLSAGLPH